MADKKLESFRIGDTHHRPTVSAPRRPQEPSQEQQSEAASLGVRRIEKIIESEQSEDVAQALGGILRRLEAHHEQATTQRAKAAAKKAIAAVERSADLMDYLFRTKDSLQEASRK
ncbi:MAG: hypothetical protein AAB426_00915 [Myxococcota bacterium]